MSDRIRQGLAFVIAMGMVSAVASVPTLAQEATGDDYAIAAINADSVDGRHAVGATSKKGKRAGKLVAADKQGFLPANIVKPYWGNIKNKPAGFADGKDNAGVTQLTIKQVRVNGTIPGNSSRHFTVSCPSGYVVTGGGMGQAAEDVRIVDTEPWGAGGWVVNGLNLGSSSRDVSAYAICMTTKPGGTLKIAGE